MRALLIFACIALLAPQLASAQIVADHDAVREFDQYRDDPAFQAAIEDAKSMFHIGYGHTSHGSQITSGMTGFNTFMNGLGYPEDLFDWNNGGTGGALDLEEGASYGDGWLDHDCGYSGWDDETRNYLDGYDPGAGTADHSDVNVIMWSWCGQVDNVNIQTHYLDNMADLEDEYPGVTFIYMTGHLEGRKTGDPWFDNNNAIRDWVAASPGRVLFDFADIEKYDPDQEVNYADYLADDHCDYDSDGETPRSEDSNWATDWQGSHTEGEDWYSVSCSHSVSLNCNQKAKAFWWMMARLAGWDPNENSNYHYVNSENCAPGNTGTSWNDAVCDLNNFSELNRGDTYYIADGTYGNYTFDDAEQGDEYIYIKKAIESDHGSDIGWVSGFGDGQAVFNGTGFAGPYDQNLLFSTSNWVFDGQKRTNKDSGHGFKLEVVQPESWGINSAQDIENISVQYTEFTSVIPPTCTNSDGGYQQIGGSNLYFGYNYFHDLAGSMHRMRMIDGVVIEHSFYRNDTSWGDIRGCPSGPHGDAIQMWGNMNDGPSDEAAMRNIIIRYNEFEDIEGTAYISFAWGVDNAHVYGNIAYLTPDTDRYGTGRGFVNMIADPDELGISNLYVYNNDLINIHTNKATLDASTYPIGIEHYAYNNFWYNCSDSNSVGILNFTNFGYNYFSKSDLHWRFTPNETSTVTNENPFVDSTGGNFNLAYSIPGKDLTQESWWDPKYDSAYDINGNLRGADGVWDRGAYEYNSSSSGCNHPADTSPNDCKIDIDEITAYVNSWKSDSSISINSVMEAINYWKAGGYLG